MSKILLFPSEKDIRASLQLGGSKSISNRLLILRQALHLDLGIQNLSDSEDTQLLVQILDEVQSGRTFDFNVKHAGTDLRFLTAFLAVQPSNTYTLSGSDRLKERPIAELLEALKQLGAEIDCLEKKDAPPLRIKGKAIEGGTIQLKANISSQFISALLLISPIFPKGLELHLQGERVSKPYISMSLELLKTFGVQCEDLGNSIRVLPYQIPKPVPKTFYVESDWSSASYWFSVCALSKRSNIQLQSFQAQSLQADAQLIKIYTALGVNSTFEGNQLTLTHFPIELQEFSWDFTTCPDIAPTVACTCLGLGIKAQLTGLQTLQLKESRRIDALKTELEKFGAHVITSNHHLEISPPQQPPKGSIHVSTHHDHRMAMSFAPLALVYPGLEIEAPEVVNKSYPRFWNDLQSLGFRLNLQS
ncbi:MAG: 3-phosphoshikimate 1-carboxyvinyltransferase [Bacteroidia bacterium]|nr:3-phosphoshikimate 1-carboxyvinyltransferase [Bacteroidia bacterium]